MARKKLNPQRRKMERAKKAAFAAVAGGQPMFKVQPVEARNNFWSKFVQIVYHSLVLCTSMHGKSYKRFHPSQRVNHYQ